MVEHAIVALSIVVVGGALLAWLASQTRQPIVVGYFLCGVLLGPACLNWVAPHEMLHSLSELGVILLLFLAGLVLHPDRLRTFFKVGSVVTLAGAGLTFVPVTVLLLLWGYDVSDCVVAGLAMMFSSTILVIKLLPTTALHQKRMGSICIAILIAQDLLAVTVLLFVGPDAAVGPALIWLPVKVVALISVAVVVEQYGVRWMMRRAERYNEVLVMLCLAWCVGVAMAGSLVGIPSEVGAFIAGVTLARGKIAYVLSEELKPLRDFFLMFFFFVMGASLEFVHLQAIWLPALLVAGLIVVTRPLWLRWLFVRLGEEPAFAKETGVRLGQGSEFALVIAAEALAGGHLSPDVAQFIQLATVVSMLISSYIVVLRYPTPIGVRPRLQRD